MEISGRLSSCSVVQEESLLIRMRKTPGSPTKRGYQTTPRKSESKRCLFRANSPSGSDDLGLMSPMSASSCSSTQSLCSPQFSPNGTFTTPPSTPNNNRTPQRCSPRLSAKKIEVKSSLFPDLKLHTPKSRRTPKTPRTLLSKMLTPQSKVDSIEDLEEGIRSLSTPSTSRSSSRRRSFENNIVAESPSVGSLTQDSEEECSSREADKPTKLGIKPLSSESFYGPVPQPPKAKTKLFIDSLEPRTGARELVRSLSRDSLSSNRSFVSGGTRKRTSSNGQHRSRRSRSSHGEKRRAPHVGVWHNIKKPKQMKKTKPEKPLVSPKSRIAKSMCSDNGKEIKVKSKPFFQENPRKRIAHCKKRGRNDAEDDSNSIIDSFPDHLIKRKKFQTPRVNVHPAICQEREKTPENLTPDPNKKFLKYGQSRKAFFTITDNVKLQISGGVMKLQTPKKRRKLYSGKKGLVEEFNDFDDGENPGPEVQEKIEGILSRLQSDKDLSADLKSNNQVFMPFDSEVSELSNPEGALNVAFSGEELPLVVKFFQLLLSALQENNPWGCELDDAYDAHIFHNLESQAASKTPSKSITKSQRSPLKTVSNLPSLILNDFESEDESSPMKDLPEKSPNKVSLAKTGTMVSYLTNILLDEEQGSSENRKDESENSPPGEGTKYYSLFYKQSWNKASGLESSSKKSHAKKKILVPDDQYLLDAGQKSIGIVTCKKCGVMYQAGDFADEATHNNFHNHLSELRFTGWNNERVVGKYPDGRVIMILSADPKVWWQKVSKILDIVDQELGFPEASLSSLYYKTVYLYINEKAKQIAGCLIAEECKVAYRMFPPLEGVDIDSCSKDPSPCKAGISRIWTALSHRRKGVATRLIDCLQRTFLFGEIVSLDQIAFSVPSPSGKLLAQKVTARQDYLVYGFA